MKKNRRQRLSAIILLMVMMLQMGVRIVHQHHHDLTEHAVCSDCEHHRVHDGHVSSWDGEQHDCLLCQILATPFVQADDVHGTLVCQEHSHTCFSYANEVIECSCFDIDLRGPPFLSIIA